MNDVEGAGAARSGRTRIDIAVARMRDARDELFEIADSDSDDDLAYLLGALSKHAYFGDIELLSALVEREDLPDRHAATLFSLIPALATKALAGLARSDAFARCGCSRSPNPLSLLRSAGARRPLSIWSSRDTSLIIDRSWSSTAAVVPRSVV